MPRSGKTTAIGLLWAMLAACLICAGCTTGRDFAVPDDDGAASQTMPPARTATVAPSGVTPYAVGQTGLTQAEPAPGVADNAGQRVDEVLAPPAWAGRNFEHADATVPRELEKVTHPTYVIQPPDILLIDAARLVPRPPYRVDAMDAIAIYVTNTLPDAPIKGIYTVEPSGMVDLGFTYGSVKVFGQTLEEAKKSIANYLKEAEKLKPPFEVYVSLAESKVPQQVRGEHLVRQDGTIGLGTYGSVYVTGMTIAQAKATIEQHLAKYLFQPQVSVDVSGFNSHVYFVIFDFPGTGQTVFRLPITGNETVLDALGDLRGLPAGVSKRRIWVARPAPAKCGRTQILPVDWTAITRNGATATNYQLLPGDRIFVSQDPCLAVDVAIARFLSPFERVLGITLLGNSTIQSFRIQNQNGVGGVGAAPR
jgi:polysaccharide biosynthesis/export protein